MEIITIEQLHDKLCDAYSWRIKELANINNDIKVAQKPRKALFTRMAIVLLYAHWEGYIKEAADIYINFVSNQTIIYSDLSKSFLALAIEKQIRKINNSKKAKPYLELVDFVTSGLAQNLQIPYDTIDTESNLTSSVFENITIRLGLDYSRYALMEKLIDKDLAEKRHLIAHGQYREISEKDFSDVYVKIVNILNDFNNQLLEAVINKDYLNQAFRVRN